MSFEGPLLASSSSAPPAAPARLRRGPNLARGAAVVLAALLAGCGDGVPVAPDAATDLGAPDAPAVDVVRPDVLDAGRDVPVTPMDVPGDAPSTDAPDVRAPADVPADGAVPANLAPPAGQSQVLRVAARGVQIYACTSTAPADGGVAADGGAGFQWTFRAPEATLYDASGNLVGTHFAGPTWRTTDTSQVRGTLVTRADAPAAAAIPWLLLRGSAMTGTGVLGRTRFIHRVATTGGVAPTTGCDAAAVGSDRRVPYTADYYFWGTP